MSREARGIDPVDDHHQGSDKQYDVLIISSNCQINPALTRGEKLVTRAAYSSEKMYIRDGGNAAQRARRQKYGEADARAAAAP